MHAGQKRRKVELFHLTGDANRQLRRIEAADRADAALAVEAGRPKRFFAQAVGSNDSHTRHNNSTHGLSSPEIRSPQSAVPSARRADGAVDSIGLCPAIPSYSSRIVQFPLTLQP